MHRVAIYRKLLNATAETNLAALKLNYRSLIKEWHPDRIINDEEKKNEAEIKSKKIIEAYHFLVSISPETKLLDAENYAQITAAPFITDYVYKGTTLKITFPDGSVYEYFGVPKKIYTNMVNSPTIARFARRHIYNSYTYRNVSKQVED